MPFLLRLLEAVLNNIHDSLCHAIGRCRLIGLSAAVIILSADRLKEPVPPYAAFDESVTAVQVTRCGRHFNAFSACMVRHCLPLKGSAALCEVLYEFLGCH